MKVFPSNGKTPNTHAAFIASFTTSTSILYFAWCWLLVIRRRIFFVVYIINSAEVSLGWTDFIFFAFVAFHIDIFICTLFFFLLFLLLLFWSFLFWLIEIMYQIKVDRYLLIYFDVDARTRHFCFDVQPEWTEKIRRKTFSSAIFYEYTDFLFVFRKKVRVLVRCSLFASISVNTQKLFCQKHNFKCKYFLLLLLLLLLLLFHRIECVFLFLKFVFFFFLIIMYHYTSLFEI